MTENYSIFCTPLVVLVRFLVYYADNYDGRIMSCIMQIDIVQCVSDVSWLPGISCNGVDNCVTNLTNC